MEKSSMLNQKALGAFFGNSCFPEGFHHEPFYPNSEIRGVFIYEPGYGTRRNLVSITRKAKTILILEI